MAYLLDTNVLSDLIRNPKGRAARRIAEVGPSEVHTSVVAAGELRFGAGRRSARLAARVEELLREIIPRPMGPPADRHYASIRHHLEKIGRPIGSNDLLIAAHALELGSTLVTDNTREFSRVPSLRIENWLR
jgi:tRNA(fMet)-specific endonuclease VapC